ncbi:MAG: DUF6702 family protein [Bacteroidota bacterium]
MKYWIAFLFFCWANLGLQAHQPDLSSTMLIEQADKQWSVVVRASLSAFEQEIKLHYPEEKYQSPEDFQALVIRHVQNKLGIVANQGDTLLLRNPIVKLGHESNVIFMLQGMPDELEALSIQNSSFEDIHHSQNALILIKRGLTQKQFILNEYNQHQANVVIEEGQFVLSQQGQKADFSFALRALLGLLVIILGLVFFKLYQVQRQKENRSAQQAPLPYSHTIIRDLR